MTFNRHTRSRAGLGLLMAFFATGSGWASDPGEFYVNTYRSVGSVSPKGIRASGMGGGGRGLADGAASLGVNPAAMGVLRNAEAGAALGYDWLDDGTGDASQTSFRLGGAVNLERLGGGSGLSQGVGGLLEAKSFRNAAGQDMERSQTGLLAAYGLQISDNLLGGASVALFDGKWKSGEGSSNPAASLLPMDRGFTGGDFRLGGLYRLRDETTLGAAVNYGIGSFRENAAYAAGSGSGTLRRVGAGLGLAHQYGENTLILGDFWFERLQTSAVGVMDEHANAWGVSAGLEQRVIPELLALRGGLYYDRTSYSGSGPGGRSMIRGGKFDKGRLGVTAGAGLRIGSFDIGYSLDVNSGGEVRNLLDVSAEW